MQTARAARQHPRRTEYPTPPTNHDERTRSAPTRSARQSITRT